MVSSRMLILQHGMIQNDVVEGIIDKRVEGILDMVKEGEVTVEMKAGGEVAVAEIGGMQTTGVEVKEEKMVCTIMLTDGVIIMIDVLVEGIREVAAVVIMTEELIVEVVIIIRLLQMLQV